MITFDNRAYYYFFFPKGGGKYNNQGYIRGNALYNDNGLCYKSDGRGEMLS